MGGIAGSGGGYATGGSFEAGGKRARGNEVWLRFRHEALRLLSDAGCHGFEWYLPVTGMHRHIAGEDVAILGFRHEDQADDNGRAGYHNRIPEPEVEAAGLRVHGEHGGR